MRKIIGMLTLALSLSSVLTSCGGLNTPPPPPQQSTSGAHTANVAAQYHIPVNANGNTVEQQQIIDKNRITNDPTKVLWMHRLNMDGKIIMRTPVRSKITSSGKRLEPISCAAGMANGQGIDQYYGARTPSGLRTTEVIQIDGTYGHSDEYVYWFDPQGHYFQMGHNYILSDMPIDLDKQADEITGVFQAHKAAMEWQKEQEAKLAAGK